VWIISDQRWKQLSPKAQAAMTQAGQEASLHACAKLDGDVPKDIALLSGKGVSIQRLPEATHQSVVAATSDIAKSWAAELDKRGKPGTAVLTEFRTLVDAEH
jgi:TRAP-type C4-dicarboxylate transport system substrate-binding protein